MVNEGSGLFDSFWYFLAQVTGNVGFRKKTGQHNGMI